MAARSPHPMLRAPAGLAVEVFELGEKTFAVLEWPLEGHRTPAVLRPAERDILDLVLAGLSNAEIAGRRRRSVRTVAHQVDTIYRRLGVGSRQELLALLFRGSP
jgi:DNA-binding CsgD family transcriptional regulator